MFSRLFVYCIGTIAIWSEWNTFRGRIGTLKIVYRTQRKAEYFVSRQPKIISVNLFCLYWVDAEISNGSFGCFETVINTNIMRFNIQRCHEYGCWGLYYRLWNKTISDITVINKQINKNNNIEKINKTDWGTVMYTMCFEFWLR